MKILECWSVAGIGSMLAHKFRELGHDAICVNRKGYDKFQISKYYKANTVYMNGDKYIHRISSISKDYDVVHVHAAWKVLSHLHCDKVIMHYHGSELSQHPNNLERLEEERYATKVFVSTPDLIQYGNHTYIPNPVDTDLFKHRVDLGTGAVAFDCGHDSHENFRHAVKKVYKSTVKLIKRKDSFVAYKNMPMLLANFSILIDVKPATWIDEGSPVALSTTGLQALSMGLTVIDKTGKEHTQFPLEHHLNIVANKWIDIYKNL